MYVSCSWEVSLVERRVLGKEKILSIRLACVGICWIWVYSRFGGRYVRVDSEFGVDLIVKCFFFYLRKWE